MRTWDPARASKIIAEEAAGERNVVRVLRQLTDAFGFIEKTAAPEIAEAFNVTLADVRGVVSFYEDFRTRPPGARVVKICQAEACQASGCRALTADVLAELGIALGETTPDGKLTVEAVYCLGACPRGPAALIDDALFLPSGPDAKDELLGRCREGRTS